MRLIVLLLLLCPGSAMALDRGEIVDRIVVDHVLPGFESFAEATSDLNEGARGDCHDDTALRAGYHAAFDAWMGVSHLRFGPTEEADRAFAIAFWPDTKGFIPKNLNALFASKDAAVISPEAFAEVSIAGRGLFALEFLLFDPQFEADQVDASYRCDLIRAITTDLDRMAADILSDWQDSYADTLRNTGPEHLYRSDDEAAQELFKALLAGLQLTSDARLGRPMGSFEKPRPRRAEARRSGRSLDNVILSLEALAPLAAILSVNHPDILIAFEKAFGTALKQARRLDDPVFAGVATTQGRFRIEALQSAVDQIRTIAGAQLGPALDLAAGFNALDGD